jgi:hypothetical protein
MVNVHFALKDYPGMVAAATAGAERHAGGGFADSFKYMAALGYFWQGAFDKALDVAKGFDDLAAIHAELELANSQYLSLLPLRDMARREVQQHQHQEQLRQLLRSNVGEGGITLFDAKGRTGRGLRRHTIPLITAAREALQTLLSLNPGEFPFSIDGGHTPLSAKTISDWAKGAAAGLQWTPTDKPVGAFQAKRIRSGVETALASLGVSQEIRGHLLSHGVTGVQSASYDGHDYAPQKLEALETLYSFLTGPGSGARPTSTP